MTDHTPAAQGKTSGELADLRALFDQAVTPEDWRQMLQRLAQSENPKVIELLLNYRFGSPVTPVDRGADSDALVRITLPAVEGGTHGADDLEAAPGAANAVSPEQRG